MNSTFSDIILFKKSLLDDDTEKVSRDKSDNFTIIVENREPIMLAVDKFVIDVLECFDDLEGHNWGLHDFLGFKEFSSS